MNPARSLLFVPANRAKLLDKALSLPADGVILDLEDSVPAEEKPRARLAARDYTARIPGSAWIRVNAPDSPHHAEDLHATAGAPRLAGYMVPKADTVAQVKALDQQLAMLEAEHKLEPGHYRLILLMESARAVFHAYELATASPRVFTLVFGGARDADLQNDLGCSWSLDGPEMLHARQQALLAMRAAGVTLPLDGVYADVRDKAGFEKDTGLSRRLGYRGRAVVHPDQVEAANRLYAPTATELEYYSRVLAAMDEARKRGEAATTVDGRMVDEAMAVTARRVLAQAPQT
jgi:citrate lyase subunit beta / citryl-CoA lyase